MKRLALALLAFAILTWLCPLVAASPVADAPKLALLIGVPGSPSETDAHNDLAAMYDALVRRGFSRHQILVLEGELNAALLDGFLADAAQRTHNWKEGQLFLYYTGHGCIDDSLMKAGLLLNGDEQNGKVYWEHVFSKLNLPPSIDLVLLPDC